MTGHVGLVDTTGRAAADVVRRPVSTPRRLELTKVAVASGVIGDPVPPAAPEDPNPGPSQGADRVGVILASGAGPRVDLSCPGVPVAGGVGERGDGVSQALVA